MAALYFMGRKLRAQCFLVQFWGLIASSIKAAPSKEGEHQSGVGMHCNVCVLIFNFQFAAFPTQSQTQIQIQTQKF